MISTVCSTFIVIFASALASIDCIQEAVPLLLLSSLLLLLLLLLLPVLPRDAAAVPDSGGL
jgi:hypothetical protein